MLLVVFLVCLVFAGVAGYGDFQEVWRRMSQFPPLYLVWAFGLALINYLLRFLRWALYLKILQINAPFHVSLLVFLGGLAMTITPGKVGELVKCYLLRDRAGVPVSTSIPIVLMERVTDLVSVVLMGLAGLFLLPPLLSTSLLLALAVVVAVLYMLSTRHTEMALGLPIVRRWQEEIREARQGIMALSRPWPMAAAPCRWRTGPSVPSEEPIRRLRPGRHRCRLSQWIARLGSAHPRALATSGHGSEMAARVGAR